VWAKIKTGAVTSSRCYDDIDDPREERSKISSIPPESVKQLEKNQKQRVVGCYTARPKQIRVWTISISLYGLSRVVPACCVPAEA
jgi:hypothetical protein